MLLKRVLQKLDRLYAVQVLAMRSELERERFSVAFADAIAVTVAPAELVEKRRRRVSVVWRLSHVVAERPR